MNPPPKEHRRSINRVVPFAKLLDMCAILMISHLIVIMVEMRSSPQVIVLICTTQVRDVGGVFLRDELESLQELNLDGNMLVEVSGE